MAQSRGRRGNSCAQKAGCRVNFISLRWFPQGPAPISMLSRVVCLEEIEGSTYSQLKLTCLLLHQQNRLRSRRRAVASNQRETAWTNCTFLQGESQTYFALPFIAGAGKTQSSICLAAAFPGIKPRNTVRAHCLHLSGNARGGRAANRNVAQVSDAGFCGKTRKG